MMFFCLSYSLHKIAWASSFFSSKRRWITSSALALVRKIRVVKRPWIREKSCDCCAFKSPTVDSISICEVTTIKALPSVLSVKPSAMVWSESIRCTSFPINWPTSSTKKMKRLFCGCLAKWSFTKATKLSMSILKLAIWARIFFSAVSLSIPSIPATTSANLCSLSIMALRASSHFSLWRRSYSDFRSSYLPWLSK